MGVSFLVDVSCDEWGGAELDVAQLQNLGWVAEDGEIKCPECKGE
jgi:hypothetical protein